MIPSYPQSTEFSLALRPRLHPLFQQLPDGISEFTFANLYLFRKAHHYRLATLPDGNMVIIGRDRDQPFFMLPFGLPAAAILQMLFADLRGMKCVSASQAERLRELGYTTREDRDNADYLYRRQDLAELSGRKFSQKRNHIKAFINNYDYRGEPLTEAHLAAALSILDQWRAQRSDAGDYEAAREALEQGEELQLCGGIYYADDRPVAYSLGEELMQGRCFAIHFEKAVAGYKGVWQFVNQAFASILPDKYETINREQDLGDEGLRAAKLSYKPVGFVMKYRATAA